MALGLVRFGSRVAPLRRAAFAAVALACALAGGCATSGGSAIADATAAFNAAEYGRSLSLARQSVARSEGMPRFQARYLEGLSLLKLKRFDEAIEPLEDAADAPNRALAADARVSLGTAHIGRGELAEAADAYRRASMILEGDERARAQSIEAECRARLVVRAAPPAAEPPAAAPVVAATDAVAPTPSAPTVAPEPPRPSTPTSRIVNGLEVEPIAFAIQAGAFRERQKASAVAGQLRAQVALLRLAPPRVIEKTRADGTVVHVVQFGSFPNRTAAGQALKSFPQSGYTVERVAE